MPSTDARQPDQPERLSRPLLLYDGNCGFCRFWVARWQAATRGAVDFAPAQAESTRFPQITKEALTRAVQLITPEGALYAGAEAVFRTLAYAPGHGFGLAFYRQVPGVRPVTEGLYRVIAGHRDFFSGLTRLLWGRDPEPSSYLISRWLFLRLLGLVYVIAFLSLRVQIVGLLGARGILPAGSYLEAVRSNFGSVGYRLFPTLAWFNSSDACLKLLCSGGAVCGLLVMLGAATGPALVLAWTAYLSLVTVGRDFLSFQWDILLLEAGFLASFLAPWRALEPPWRSGSSPASPAILWLGRWLLFRLMFLSGAVKLLSGDRNWRNLTALEYHYWTQPLPTPPAWYAAQLPAWFQKLSVLMVFALELAIPFLVLAPRRLRRAGAVVIIVFQFLIALTGNYAFFNLLAVVLCVLALDDSFWKRCLPKRMVERSAAQRPAGILAPAGRAVRAAVTLAILVISSSELVITFGHAAALPGLALQIVDWQSPYCLANSYGLFAVMTTSRIEIEVEGSNDGQNWLPYEFKYKPGDIRQAPRWVEPHEPRLDWQMWFAALGTYQQNRWFVNFMIRLLQGAPEVTALLEKNPFPNGPPHYIRAMAYDYHFTDSASRRKTGDWWRRNLNRTYFPIASLRGP